MTEKCLFIDSDGICQILGEKCTNPKDDNCPSYQPNDEDNEEEEKNDE